MKRLLSVAVALMALAFVAAAQPKAVGLRFGNYGVDVSYENYSGDNDFLEFELGLDSMFSTSAFHLDGIYNFMIARPDWTVEGQWGFYVGPGASVAVWDNGKDENVVYAGLLGNVGLEYIFDFPLQLSLSLRPRFMFGDGKIRRNGLLTLGLGVRYMF
ncbi:MAG: hypothetical protein J6N54_04290 [Bacteroidales bacterium]|nr:hypothetical protein [Bacteroidales bacterium]